MRALLGTFVTTLTILLVGLATGMLSARLLLPAGRGELAEILFWGSTLLSFGMLALPTAVAIEVARDPQRELLGSSLALATLISGTLVGAFLCAAPWLIQERLLFPVMAFAALTIPAGLLGQTLLAIDHGNRKFQRYNLMRLLPSSVYLIGMLALWNAGLVSPTMLAFANGIGSVAVVVAAVSALPRQSVWRVSRERMKSLLVLGSTMHLGSLSSLLLQSADQATIIFFFDHAALGYYAVALTASGVGIGIISGTALTVFLPRMSAASDATTRSQYARSLLGSTFMAALALGAVSAAAAPILIPVLFGTPFREAVPIAIVLCLAQVPSSYVGAAGITLQILGDWRSSVIARLLGLVAFVPSAGLLAPRIGVVGIALALVIAWTSAMIYLLPRLKERLGISALQCVTPPADVVTYQYGALLRTLGRLGPSRSGAS